MRSDYARLWHRSMVNSYLEELFSLAGRVAVVTGASRGIGGELARALCLAGAQVIGIARSAVPSEKLPPAVGYRQCDALEAEAFAKICADAFDTHKRLDILVNAAGIALPDTDQGDRFQAFDRTLATNLAATYRCCEVASGFMKKSGGGTIINVTSIASVLGFPNNPGYVAAKGGLRMLTKALAQDLAPFNIRVNNLAPGYIRTAMTEGSFSDPKLHRERVERMMIERWGMPQDLAGAAIFLASDASRYVTGTDLFVDGGWTAKGL